MAMKQTQTKMFDFADVGLDFCPGSKNLFPDRFKKMLSQGYNEQTVASVSVTGNQVTLNYGVSHGYAADRVLKINSGPLAAINSGEFWIDAVTATSLTMTIDAAPSAVTGGFTTKIASMGYALVYEQLNIQVYKFKSLDESDLFLRLCFQNQSARRNCISPCVGKSYDPVTGIITDPNALGENKEILTPGDGFKWDLQQAANATFNNYSYTQGFSNFGKALTIGSAYHFVMLTSTANTTGYGCIAAILPTNTFNYNEIKYPVVIGSSYGNITGASNGNMLASAKAYLGAVQVLFHSVPVNSPPYSYIDYRKQALSSFLPSNLDSFNTTTAETMCVYAQGNGQILGCLYGAYKVKLGIDIPAMNSSQSPSETADIDLSHKIILHYISDAGSPDYAVFYAFPIEEIKIEN